MFFDMILFGMKRWNAHVASLVSHLNWVFGPKSHWFREMIFSPLPQTGSGKMKILEVY